MVESVVFLVGEVRATDQLAGELGCNWGSLPSTYLGLPLGASFNSLFGKELRKNSRKFIIWKRRFISKGRRLTLI